MTVSWDVTDENKDVESALEEIIADEARTFTQNIRQRLRDAGVEEIEMNLTERQA
jgi:hypothetical protein